jgi:hypothetical protein
MYKYLFWHKSWVFLGLNVAPPLLSRGSLVVTGGNNAINKRMLAPNNESPTYINLELIY